MSLRTMGVKRGIASAASLRRLCRHSWQMMYARFLEDGDPPEDPPVDDPAETPAEPAEDSQVAGLKAAAIAEREKRQAAEAESSALRNQVNAAMAQKPTEPKMPVFDKIAKQMGFDLDYMTPSEQGQVVEAMVDMRAREVTAQLSQSNFLGAHSDYSEVVGVNVGGVFQPAPPLARQLKANPELESALKSSPDAQVLAYMIARQDPQYQKELAESGKPADTKAAEKAQAAIEAAKKQVSISAATGGGTLDPAAALAAMTDEEFAEHNRKIIAKA